VVEALFGSQAITWPNLQQSKDKILRTLCHRAPSRFRKAQIALDNLSVELVKHIVEEWQGPLKTT